MVLAQYLYVILEQKDQEFIESLIYYIFYNQLQNPGGPKVDYFLGSIWPKRLNILENISNLCTDFDFLFVVEK